MRFTKSGIHIVPPDLITKIAQKLGPIAPLDAIALCWAKITPDFLRSRSNYSNVAHLLQIARDVATKRGEESKWEEHLRRFATEHRGKK